MPTPIHYSSFDPIFISYGIGSSIVMNTNVS